MKQKLTKRIVEALPFTNGPKKQFLIWDSELRGFGLRISSTTKTYIAQAKCNGSTVRETLGKHGIITAEEARKKAMKAIAEIRSGHNPNKERQAARRKSKTLAQAYLKYIESRAGRLKANTLRDYRYCVDYYLLDWQNKPLADISCEMIESKHRQLSERSWARANLAMRFLRALYNYSAEDIPNPVKRLTAQRLWNRIPRRERYIREEQLKDWWEAVWQLKNSTVVVDAETVRDYLLLLLFTGLRREEALGMTWDNVDFKSRTFTLLDTKNRLDHLLPMSDQVLEIFERRREVGFAAPWVFPSPISKNGRLIEVRYHINEVVERSGIIFSSHDLRRTFATIAQATGVDYLLVKRLLNHKVSDVTAGYIQRDPAIMRRAMQSIADYIAARVEQHNLMKERLPQLPDILSSNKLVMICRDHGVARLGVFGSVARGEARVDSDIDLLVAFSMPKSLLGAIAFERVLGKVLGRKVDLVTEAGLSPHLRETVYKELRPLYAA